jgi:hypothetical protein
MGKKLPRGFEQVKIDMNVFRLKPISSTVLGVPKKYCSPENGL